MAGDFSLGSGVVTSTLAVLAVTGIALATSGVGFADSVGLMNARLAGGHSVVCRGDGFDTQDDSNFDEFVESPRLEPVTYDYDWLGSGASAIHGLCNVLGDLSRILAAGDDCINIAWDEEVRFLSAAFAEHDGSLVGTSDAHILWLANFDPEGVMSVRIAMNGTLALSSDFLSKTSCRVPTSTES